MPRPRSCDDLKREALFWWPDEILGREAHASIIPRLINTQDRFISLLHVADSSPYAWKEILPQTSDLPGNLFLKHLIVLSDLGGEPLKRLSRDCRQSLSTT
jgi:hypothetical protein